MKTRNKIGVLAFTLALATFTFTGCRKDMLVNPSTASAAESVDRVNPVNAALGDVSIMLTNTSQAGPYGKVDVDIIGAVVHYMSSTGLQGYIALPIQKGTYDLNALRITPLHLGHGAVPATRIDQVRLVFGVQNNIVIGDNLFRHEYLMQTPKPNFVNVALNAEVVQNKSTVITLDFQSLNSVSEEDKMEGNVMKHAKGGTSVVSHMNAKVFILDPFVVLQSITQK